MTASSRPLDKDDVFDILSNARRRQLLFLLYGQGKSVKLSDLAQDIADAEGEGDAGADRYKRVYISLYQTHVPKLKEHGIVEYDADTKTVEMTERVRDIVAIFQTPADRRPWWRYYGVVALISGAVVLGSWAFLSEGGTINVAISFVPVTLLVLVVLFHYYTKSRAGEALIDRLIT